MKKPFPVGKLSNEDLLRFIFPNLGKMRPEVLVHASVGEDAAALDLLDELCVLSTDPITGSRDNLGWLAVNVSTNDIAATGAEPVGLLLTALLPPEFSPAELSSLMEDVSRAANFLNIEVLGGHTEVTPYLSQPVLIATSVGKVPRGGLLHSAGAQAGDLLYASKSLGLEGTAILAKEFAQELIPILGKEMVERAESFLLEISVAREGLLARLNGAHALHDVTEGGIIGGVMEMMQASRCGVFLNIDSLPFRPETTFLCQALDLDPLFLISSGSMLIAAPEGCDLRQAFALEGIELSQIGKFIAEQKLLVQVEGKVEEWQPTIHEELWRALERRRQ